jgi:hypothetical protein
MILGLTTSAYTELHVFISLAAILSGIIAVLGIILGKPYPVITAFFLTTTVLTSVTGFLFPFHGVTPGIVVGIISLVILLFAILARYAGSWPRTYAATAVIALYLNFFVLIVQSFMKVSALHALAPTQAEAPFKIAQGIALIVFVILGILAVKRSRAADA